MSCIFFFFLLGFGFLLVFGWHRASGSGSILMVMVVGHVSDMGLLWFNSNGYGCGTCE